MNENNFFSSHQPNVNVLIAIVIKCLAPHHRIEEAKGFIAVSSNVYKSYL